MYVFIFNFFLNIFTRININLRGALVMLFGNIKNYDFLLLLLVSLWPATLPANQCKKENKLKGKKYHTYYVYTHMYMCIQFFLPIQIRVYV